MPHKNSLPYTLNDVLINSMKHDKSTSRLTSLCFTFHSAKLRWTSTRLRWCCKPAVKLLITWSLRWIDCSYVASSSRNASMSFCSLVPSPMCLRRNNSIIAMKRLSYMYVCMQAPIPLLCVCVCTGWGKKSSPQSFLPFSRQLFGVLSNFFLQIYILIYYYLSAKWYMILLKNREIMDFLKWLPADFPSLKMFKLQHCDSIMSF